MTGKEKTVDLDTITSHLITNAKKLRYGTASVVLKIHEGSIVGVTHQTHEVITEKEAIK